MAEVRGNKPAHQPIIDLAESLYREEQPTFPIYHYTSLRGVTGIVSTKSIWATEIHYLNDSQELKHLGGLVENDIRTRPHLSKDAQDITYSFRYWLPQKLEEGHRLFVTSFTKNGNLLSQWRGYCPVGQGVSIGFGPDVIAEAAKRAGCALAKCIYDEAKQAKIATAIVDLLIDLAGTVGPKPGPRSAASYYHIFEDRLEPHLLRIAALLKDPAYREEEEWRMVSDVVTPHFPAPPMKFREGKTYLIPYRDIPLAQVDRPLSLDHVFVGPTPDVDLSIASMAAYLAESRAPPTRGVEDSSVPFRG